jgi:hypothetical protein
VSTRACIHFHYTGLKTERRDGPEAIVFRHTDGYPSETGKDLLAFFADAPEDTRFNDPTMLAARYVVWLANQFAHGDNPLDFLSVRVMQEDSGDIAFRYHVYCDYNSRGDTPPKVVVEECYGSERRLPLKDVLQGFPGDDED